MADDDPSMAVPENGAPKLTVEERVAQLEARWGKPWEEVMVDMHDHIFGKTVPPVEPVADTPGD